MTLDIGMAIVSSGLRLGLGRRLIVTPGYQVEIFENPFDNWIFIEIKHDPTRTSPTAMPKDGERHISEAKTYRPIHGGRPPPW
jgi:hypothetical protein